MKILITTISSALLVLLLAFISHPLSPGTGETKYILVKSSFMMRSNILKPNAALLITNEKEIKENEDIFFFNTTAGHACGYHYDIQFWENSTDLNLSIPFNQECEEFLLHNSDIQARMKWYIKQLETKPTHYIYNLKIPVTTPPDSLLQKFEGSGLHVFFIDGKTNDLGSLTIRYMQISRLKEEKDKSKWEGERKDNQELAFKKITAIVNDVKKVIPVLEETKINYPMQGFGITIEHQAEITIKFANGTNLSRVKEIIKSHGGTIEKEKNPDFYFVQLVDTTDQLENAKSKLKDYSFVKEVFEYSETE